MHTKRNTLSTAPRPRGRLARQSRSSPRSASPCGRFGSEETRAWERGGVRCARRSGGVTGDGIDSTEAVAGSARACRKAPIGTQTTTTHEQPSNPPARHRARPPSRRPPRGASAPRQPDDDVPDRSSHDTNPEPQKTDKQTTWLLCENTTKKNTAATPNIVHPASQKGALRYTKQYTAERTSKKIHIVN